MADYLSVEETAAVMSLSEVEVIRLVKRGELRNHGSRHIIRIAKAGAKAYAKAHSNELDEPSDIDDKGAYDDDTERTSEPGDDDIGDESDDGESDDDDDTGEDSDGDIRRAGTPTRYATVADSATPVRGGDVARDTRGEGTYRGADSDPNIAALAESVRQLTALVGGIQADVTKLKPEEFAPDDADLREEAAATAKAIQDPESGINVGSLGRKDGKSKASERLVEAMFNTPDSKIDEMTDITGTLAAAAAAGVRTLNQFVATAFDRKPNDKPVFMSDIFLNNVFRLNRSIGGRHMMRALAMSQIERESEEAQEKNIIFGGPGD